MFRKDFIKEVLRSLGVSKEEALAQAVSELADTEKIKMFSEIYPIEDDCLAIMCVIAKRYKLRWLEDFIKEKLTLRVSMLRKGRAEFVSMIAEKEKGKRLIAFPFRREKKKEREVVLVE